VIERLFLETRVYLPDRPAVISLLHRLTQQSGLSQRFNRPADVRFGDAEHVGNLSLLDADNTVIFSCEHAHQYTQLLAGKLRINYVLKKKVPGVHESFRTPHKLITDDNLSQVIRPGNRNAGSLLLGFLPEARPSRCTIGSREGLIQVSYPRQEMQSFDGEHHSVLPALLYLETPGLN